MVQRNRITGTSDSGIDLDGNDALIERNICSMTDDEGLSVYGDGFRVLRNRISGVFNDSDGMDLSSATERGGGLVEKNVIEVAPKSEQKYIYRLYRISTLIQEEHPDKNLVWATRMFRKIYDGTASTTWPDDIPKVLAAIGLDAKAIEKKAKDNEAKYLAVVEKNQEWCHASGHGGVPNAVFRGEPFWGQDRIDTLVWRLKQNGLTERQQPALK